MSLKLFYSLPMPLMEFITNIDHAVFQFINQSLSSVSIDPIMSFFSESKSAFFGIVPLFSYLFWKKRERVLPVLISAAISIGLSDLTAARIFKPYFERSRPQYVISTTHIVDQSSTSFGFPSNHAANSFAAAQVFAAEFSFFPTKVLFFSIALIVGVSRIYLGLHFPGDILGGAMLGIAIAIGVQRLTPKVLAKLQKARQL